MRTTESAPERTTAPFGGPPGCLLLGTPFMDRVLPPERGPSGNVASLLLCASQRPGSDLIRKYPAYNTHRGLGVQTSSNRPGVETPDYPAPLSAEPRSLRPTIGWPASGAMRHPAYQLLRIHLPCTPVNRGTKATTVGRPCPPRR